MYLHLKVHCRSIFSELAIVLLTSLMSDQNTTHRLVHTGKNSTNMRNLITDRTADSYNYIVYSSAHMLNTVLIEVTNYH